MAGHKISLSLPDVCESPNQLNQTAFPKRSYGKAMVVNRLFQVA